MTLATGEIPETMLPCQDISGESCGAPPCGAAQDSFVWWQLSAAGLVAIAEKLVASRELDLAEAITLSHVSLPLLGKLVELRSSVCDTRKMTAATLPLTRMAARPESPLHIAQPLDDWESFCRTLVTTRGEMSSAGSAIFWYPIVGQPLDQDLRCERSTTGVEILRAIALARLVLPPTTEVLAPLATLGPKLAQVALEFGASHLGYVAPDGKTSSDPLVADPSVLEDLSAADERTCLKDS